VTTFSQPPKPHWLESGKGEVRAQLQEKKAPQFATINILSRSAAGSLLLFVERQGAMNCKAR
jgi:hypothetical protein